MNHWGQVFRDPIRSPFDVLEILCPQTNCTHIWIFVHAIGHLLLQLQKQTAEEGPSLCKISCQQDQGGESVWRRGCMCSEILKDLMKTEPFKILLNIISLAKTHLRPPHTTILLERKLTIFFFKTRSLSTHESTK